MRLTVEEDRETIKRYGHIRPARVRGAGACAARCPGADRTCTREAKHRGPHVAHDLFRRVVAVWDTEPDVRRALDGKTAVGPGVHREVWTGGLGEVVQAVWKHLPGRTASAGEIAMFVLFVAFVVFAIEWLLLIFR